MQAFPKLFLRSNGHPVARRKKRTDGPSQRQGHQARTSSSPLRACSRFSLPAPRRKPAWETRYGFCWKTESDICPRLLLAPASALFYVPDAKISAGLLEAEAGRKPHKRLAKPTEAPKKGMAVPDYMGVPVGRYERCEGQNTEILERQ